MSKRLKAQGIITNDAVFRWYADHKNGVDLQPGYYTLKPRDTMGNILAVLRTPPAQTFDNVVFPEGFTIAQIGQRLQETIPRLQQAASDPVRHRRIDPLEVRTGRHQQPRGPHVPGQVPDRRQRTEAKVVQRLVTQMEKVGASTGLDKLGRPRTPTRT